MIAYMPDRSDCDERLRRGIDLRVGRVVWLPARGEGREFVNDLKIDGL